MGKKILKISKYRPSIFQGHLDFASVGGVTLSAEHPLERNALRALMAILFVLLCGYFYFVSASVLNIIARKEADSKSIQLQTSIAVMEQEYFALSKSVDSKSASQLGLVPVKNTKYVYVPGNAATAGTVTSHSI